MELEQLKHDFLARIQTAHSTQTLDEVRVAALGKKGVISLRLKQLGEAAPKDRKILGAAINEVKQVITKAIEARGAALQAQELSAQLAGEWIDLSLPVPEAASMKGRLHPISQIIDEMTAIFSDMGFCIAEGPDIETDYYNFTALNFPQGHPAREMHDTFFLPHKQGEEKRVLRTHTSPVQIRTMEIKQPPIRVVIPGRTYRCDSDQTHTPMFHQIEGLVVDTSSHIGQMRWVLEEFLKALFEINDVTLRFRPSYFPFTEPSMEVDVGCSFEGGAVKIGGSDEWLEILGCGMVHPNVLRAGGLDPAKYQGFAWGIGIDRVAMLKYGMPDLRAFFDADQRWINHYGFRPLDMPTLFGGLSQ